MVEVIRFQAIKVPDIKKFNSEDLLSEYFRSVESSIMDRARPLMEKLLEEYKDDLKRLPAIRYYINDSKRIYISMHLLVEHLKFVISGTSIVIIFDGSHLVFGNYRIPMSDIIGILEYGSASHKYPATGLYKKLKQDYTTRFKVLLKDSLFDVFDDIVNYCVSKVGSKTQGYSVSMKF